MFIKEHMEKVTISKKIFNHYDMKKIMFFDIETTGFDKGKNSVILISAGWFVDKSTFFIRQYFAESLEEEKDVLNVFKKDITDFNVWCSYNGKAFDEPFIKRKMKVNNIEFIEPKMHIDLYRIIRPYYKQLGIERCNLKSVEKFLEIEREDNIDGGICVELYFHFLDNKDFELRDIIMLHNFEDVLNLPPIFQIVYDIECNSSLKREDCITKKQLKYLNYLLRKNKITIDEDIERISRKAASRIISCILKGKIDECEFKKIINNSY
ncbi:ribonuclease H-like domain-containing protein [Clostridium ganghwense]|uniref:Ribonuclease H-like domain-containing protein n=1 Tax=Clostridium ganghwense TaxID=312089 RepID=A0ABT4CPE0_9CLOT|nr:ribonuclease H-like domain-containing protein [Clostridium ganghwense]MCY6370920.1 ribonuclease H-like domain-containing protein [Clostridium ganghwense]